MGQSEIKIFIILVGIVTLVFITGIILFIFQYRERKIVFEKEKEKIEEQHRAHLLNTQLEIQQQTMQFIGREIHDSVTQKLTLASIYTQRMEFENLYPDMLDKLKGVSSIINDSLVELRDLSRGLTETNLSNSELVEMLLLECERVNDTGICKATLHASEAIILPIPVKSFLLRTIQEFIQNSLKHSGCSTIDVDLKTDSQGLNLIVSDNGSGFDMAIAHGRGAGLNNMRRRIQTIGGKFNLQSTPGAGTILHLYISKQAFNQS